MRRGLTILSGVVVSFTLMVLLAPSAEALKPETFSFEWYDEFTDSDVCEFDVVLSTTGSGKETTFFDKDGNPVRSVIKVTDISTATNPLSGKTISGKNNWVNTFYYESLEQTVHGLFAIFTIPGAGYVMLSAGNLHIGPPPDYEYTLQHGPGIGYNQGNVEAFCAALA